MAILPAIFPNLPGPGPPLCWGYGIVQAHKIMSQHYAQAVHALNREDGDPMRLCYHIQRLKSRVFPLLRHIESTQLPYAWVKVSACCFGQLVRDLELAANGADTHGLALTTKEDLMTIIHTGKVGRPTKRLNINWVCNAISSQHRIPMKMLATLLGIHQNTLRYKLCALGLKKRFSSLTNDQLDRVITIYKRLRPNSGLRYTTGFLHRHGIQVQRERIRMSLQRVDGLGHTLRRNDAIVHRTCISQISNAVWHLDGLHKLIQFGFVIHGTVDGHDHVVVGLQASMSNTAGTVLSLFLDSVAEYSCPSRVRGDRGGENIDVAVWMVMHQGPKRGSFLWGSSTHNTHIERLWREVASQFTRRWRAFFGRLERLHRLNRRNANHLWLLQILFLDLINIDCNAFKHDWNNHPMSTQRNQTPLDLRFISQAHHGKVVSEFNGIHPDTLQQYNNSPVPHHAHLTRHPLDADVSDSAVVLSGGSEAGEVSGMSEAEAHLTGARHPSDADISDSGVVLSGGSEAETDAGMSEAEQEASSSEEEVVLSDMSMSEAETVASVSEAEQEASSSEEEVVFSDTSSEREGTPSSASSEELLDTASGQVLGFNLHQAPTLQAQIADDIQANVNHAPVHVPRSVAPFTTDVHHALFRESLHQIQAAGVIPQGYGVLEGEWANEGYPSYESISMGLRAKKTTTELPELIWLPRAIAWVQGLHAMQTFLYKLELSN